MTRRRKALFVGFAIGLAIGGAIAARVIGHLEAGRSVAQALGPVEGWIVYNLPLGPLMFGLLTLASVLGWCSEGDLTCTLIVITLTPILNWVLLALAFADWWARTYDRPPQKPGAQASE